MAAQALLRQLVYWCSGKIVAGFRAGNKYYSGQHSERQDGRHAVIAMFAPDKPNSQAAETANVSDGLKLDCRVKPGNDGWE